MMHQDQNVAVNYGSMELPTYGWEKADPEPAFIREFTPRNQPIYPYTTQERISTTRELRTYKTVIFENDYLVVTFLPELNGRIYSAYDKINDRQMFYNNPVIKPCLFGLRGAWAAVGVEYNFPNSHSTTTLEPVPWMVEQHTDGSASFICGNIEHVSGMAWSVRVTLHPNHAVLEMESRLHNGTEFPHRFYYWINAAVPAYPDTQFIYPPSTRRLYTHPPMDISSLAYVDYPIHKGCNISFYKNVTRHFPVFAETIRDDFFGVYHHNLNSGLVHIADHTLVRGRKIWMFGNARDGKIWMDLLTENGVDYCELQSGPFTLQSDYRLLEPGHMHIQRELWYPVAGLDGFNAASEHLAANVIRSDRQVTLHLNATRLLEKVTIYVREGDRTIATATTSLDVLKPQTVTFDIDRTVEPGRFSVCINDHEGMPLLRYQDDVNIADCDKLVAQKNEDPLAQGLYLEQQGYSAEALQTYSNGKENTDCRLSIGRLKAASGQFDEALDDLHTVLAVEPDNAHAHYYAGLCHKHLGENDSASQHFSRCADLKSLAYNAVMQLAEIAVLQKQYDRAFTRLDSLTERSKSTSDAWALKAYVLRKKGQFDAARKSLSMAREIFPFDPLTIGESRFFDQKNFSNIFSHVNILDIVCRYISLNDFHEAMNVFDDYLKKNDKKSQSALGTYYHAWLGRQIAKPIDPTTQSSVWDLPFHLESEIVLKDALAIDADDDMARYYLGSFYASKGRWTQAITSFQAVTDKRYKYLASRACGLFWWKIKKDPQHAISFYEEALALESCTSKTLWEYDCLLEELKQSEKRLKMLASHRNMIVEDNRLLLRQAAALIASGDPDEALRILESNHFALCEGKHLSRSLFERACYDLAYTHEKAGDLSKAFACYRRPLTYPENLGVGKPAANMEAEWWYWSGMVLQKIGEIEKAQEYFEMGSRSGQELEIDFFPLQNVIPQHGPDQVDVGYWLNQLFRALCSFESGKNRQGQSLIERLDSFVQTKLADQRGGEPEVALLYFLRQYRLAHDSTVLNIVGDSRLIQNYSERIIRAIGMTRFNEIPANSV
jgi:tetratricopeptide (TPR) repeat protein